MGNFGEDLRMERLSRGVALEQITAVTKISQHHLVALEQERFRLLPGGILSKGIVRGYAGALGLDQHDWTERFLKAYNASGKSWTTTAAGRPLHRTWAKPACCAATRLEQRMRWVGAVVLLLIVVVAAFFTVRYFGIRAGWWATILPVHQAASARRHRLLGSPPVLPAALLPRITSPVEPACAVQRPHAAASRCPHRPIRCYSLPPAPARITINGCTLGADLAVQT